MSLKLCCQATTTLSMVTAYTVYVIYGIDFLVKYYYINVECPNSYLWSYILVSLLLTPIYPNITQIRNMKTPNLVNYFFCLFLTNACLTIWGGSELFNKSCKPIVSSDLWLYGYVTFFIQTTMLSIIGVLCICTFLIAACNNHKYKEINSINTV